MYKHKVDFCYFLKGHLQITHVLKNEFDYGVNDEQTN